MSDEIVIQTVKRLVKAGDVCVDVGANIGSVTKAMLDAGAAYVHAIEPMPKWADVIEQTFAKDMVRVHRCGVANAAREGWRVSEDPDNLGNAGLSNTEGTPILVKTLDWVLEIEARPVNFIKIDVEGMEMEVIWGGWRVIARDHPILIYETHREFEQAQGRPLFRWIEAMLRGEGYQLYDMPRDTLIKVNADTAGTDTIAIYGDPP